MGRKRFVRGLFGLVMVLVLLAGPLAVLADHITNSIIADIDGNKVIETQVGTEIEVDFWIDKPFDEPDGDVPGCNVDDKDSATVKLAVPEGVNASRTELEFTECESAASQTVTFSSQLPGIYNITVDSVEGGRTHPQAGESKWVTDSAAFTLIVVGACYDIELLPPVTMDRPFNRNSTLPVKLQVWDDGENISGMGLDVAVATLTKVNNGTVSEDAVSAGNANPDDNFRYDADLEGYIFNLSLKGLTSGTWELSFTVDGVSCPDYVVEFQVK